MSIKLGSLFDGIGGFPYAGTFYGITPVWASEIEPWPIKVTEKHFPNMKHLGDITQIDGAEIEPVDIITFGSPCQGLSLAGKREGLQDERSGLFTEAVRIIREMRRASGGEYPRFIVWENVPGAFSSNKGEDFRAVLSEIAETEIPMPRSGKWANAGMVRTERVDIAWRIINAMHWGVPQRRRRIFLVADFGGQCAGEILFVEPCLRGDSAESGKAREEAAGDAGDSVEEPNCLTSWDCQSKRIYGINSKWPTLYSGEGGGAKNQAVLISRINCTPSGITGAVSSKWAKGTGGPAGDECYNLVVEPRSQPDIAHCVRSQPSEADKPDSTTYVIQNATRGKSQNGLGISQDDVSYTLDSLGNHAICLQGSMIGRADKNGPQDDGVNEEVSFTLNTTDRHAVAYGVDKKGDDEFAKSNERNAREILRKLREEIGTEAFAEWGPGILNSLQQAEILQPGLYGEALGENGQAQKEEYIDRQPRQSDSPKDEQPDIKQSGLREVREYVEKIRHTPQGQGYIQQFARELDGIMQELPQFNSPAKGEVPDMWQSGQGIRLLRKTLSEIQEVGRPDASQNQPEYPRYAVRRLVPTECLRLQGFPDYWLDIEGMSDTQKYRSIGNSVAIPCVKFVLGGIARVLGGEKK